MSVRILADSSVNVDAASSEKITFIPLTISFGDEEYLDGVTISHRQFYEKLIETDELPTTSQASPATFMEYYENIKQAGDTAIVLTLSSNLSGTYQSAVLAAEDYEGIIYVIDTKNVSVGSGILAQLALRLIEEGLDAAAIAQRLNQARDRMHIIALLDTLEYLKKGGRISKTVAFAGGVLNIKPVVSVVDGSVVLLGKARGSKQGHNLLAAEIEKAGGIDFSMPLLLGYTGLSDVLLQKYIEDSASLWKDQLSMLDTTIIGSVVGTHVGPGAIALAFFEACDNE